MSKVVAPNGANTPSTTLPNLEEITDEELLRQMWQEADDYGERRRIRGRMYKLREKRLREMVKNDEESLGMLGSSHKGTRTQSKSTVSTSRRSSNYEVQSSDSESTSKSTYSQDNRKGSISSKKAFQVLSDEDIIDEQVKEVGKGRTDRYNRILQEYDTKTTGKGDSNKKSYSIESNALAADSYQSIKHKEVRDSISPTRSSYMRRNDDSEGRFTSDEETITRSKARTASKGTRTSEPLSRKATNQRVTERRQSKDLSDKNDTKRSSIQKSTKGTRSNVNVDSPAKTKAIKSEYNKLDAYLTTTDPTDEVLAEEEEEEVDASGAVVRTTIQTRRKKDGTEYTARRVARMTKVVNSESDVDEILIGNPDHEVISRNIEEKEEEDGSKIKIITETRRRPDGEEYRTKNILKTSKIFDYDHPEDVTYSDQDELIESKESEEMDEQGIIIKTITETRRKPSGVEYTTKKVYKTSKVPSRITPSSEDEILESEVTNETQSDGSVAKMLVERRRTKDGEEYTHRQIFQTRKMTLSGIELEEGMPAVNSDDEVISRSEKVETDTDGTTAKVVCETRKRSDGSTYSFEYILRNFKGTEGDIDKLSVNTIKNSPIAASCQDELIKEETKEEQQQDGSIIKTIIERRKAQDATEYLRHRILHIPKIPDAKLVAGSFEDEVLEEDINEDILEDGSQCRAITERRKSSVTGLQYTLRRMSRVFQPSCHLYGIDEIIDENVTEEETPDGVIIKTVIRRYQRSDDTVYTTHDVTKTYKKPVCVSVDRSREDELVDRSYDIRETNDGYIIKTSMETRCRQDGVHYTIERTERLQQHDQEVDNKFDESSILTGQPGDTVVSTEEHEEPGESGVVVKTILEVRKRQDASEYTNKITIKTTQILVPEHETSYVVIKPDPKDGEATFQPSLDDEVVYTRKKKETDEKGQSVDVIIETRLSRKTGEKYNLTKRVVTTDVVVTETGEKVLSKKPANNKYISASRQAPFKRDQSSIANKKDAFNLRTRTERTSIKPQVKSLNTADRRKVFENSSKNVEKKTSPTSPVKMGANIAERKQKFMPHKDKEIPARRDIESLKRTAPKKTETPKHVDTPIPKANKSRTEKTLIEKPSVRKTPLVDTISRPIKNQNSRPKSPLKDSSKTESDGGSSPSDKTRRNPSDRKSKISPKSRVKPRLEVIDKEGTTDRQCCKKVHDTREPARKISPEPKKETPKKTGSHKTKPTEIQPQTNSFKRPKSLKIDGSDRSSRSSDSSRTPSPTKSPKKPLFQSDKSKIPADHQLGPSNKTKSQPKSPIVSLPQTPMPSEEVLDQGSPLIEDVTSDPNLPYHKIHRPSIVREVSDHPEVSKTDVSKRTTDRTERKFSREKIHKMTEKSTSSSEDETKRTNTTSLNRTKDVTSNRVKTTRTPFRSADSSILDQIIPDGVDTGYGSTADYVPADKTQSLDHAHKPYSRRYDKVDTLNETRTDRTPFRSLGPTTPDRIDNKHHSKPEYVSPTSLKPIDKKRSLFSSTEPKEKLTERVPVKEPLVTRRYIHRLGEDDEDEEPKSEKIPSPEIVGLTSTKLVLKTMSPEPSSDNRPSSPVKKKSLPSFSKENSPTRSKEGSPTPFSKETSPSRFVTGRPIDQGPNTTKIKRVERSNSNKIQYEDLEAQKEEFKPVLNRVESISEIEQLETLLEKATTYEERRIIRGRIRSLKKSGVTSHQSPSTSTYKRFLHTTSSKQSPSASPQLNRRFNQPALGRDKQNEPKKKPQRDVSPKRTIDTLTDGRLPSDKGASDIRETTKLRKSSNEFEKRKRSFEHKSRKSSSEEVIEVTKTTHTRKSSVKTESSSQEESMCEGEERVSQREDLRQRSRSPKKSSEEPRKHRQSSPLNATPIRPSKTLPSSTKKEQQPSKNNTDVSAVPLRHQRTPSQASKLAPQSHVETIVSPYGVGPTDENGVPLFGLKALKRRQKPADEPAAALERGKSPEKVSNSSLFGLKSIKKTSELTDTSTTEGGIERKSSVEQPSTGSWKAACSYTDEESIESDDVDTGRRRRFRKKAPRRTDDSDSEFDTTNTHNKMSNPSHTDQTKGEASPALVSSIDKSLRKTSKESCTSESETEEAIIRNKNLKNIIQMHESKAVGSVQDTSGTAKPMRKLVATFQPTETTEHKVHKTWDLQSDLVTRSEDVENIIAKHETLVHRDSSPKRPTGILKKTSVTTPSNVDGVDSDATQSSSDETNKRKTVSTGEASVRSQRKSDYSSNDSQHSKSHIDSPTSNQTTKKYSIRNTDTTETEVYSSVSDNTEIMTSFRKAQIHKDVDTPKSQTTDRESHSATSQRTEKQPKPKKNTQTTHEPKKSFDLQTTQRPTEDIGPTKSKQSTERVKQRRSSEENFERRSTSRKSSNTSSKEYRLKKSEQSSTEYTTESEDDKKMMRIRQLRDDNAKPKRRDTPAFLQEYGQPSSTHTKPSSPAKKTKSNVDHLFEKRKSAIKETSELHVDEQDFAKSFKEPNKFLSSKETFRKRDGKSTQKAPIVTPITKTSPSDQPKRNSIKDTTVGPARTPRPVKRQSDQNKDLGSPKKSSPKKKVAIGKESEPIDQSAASVKTKQRRTSANKIERTTSADKAENRNISINQAQERRASTNRGENRKTSIDKAQGRRTSIKRTDELNTVASTTQHQSTRAMAKKTTVSPNRNKPKATVHIKSKSASKESSPEPSSNLKRDLCKRDTTVTKTAPMAKKPVASTKEMGITKESHIDKDSKTSSHRLETEQFVVQESSNICTSSVTEKKPIDSQITVSKVSDQISTAKPQETANIAQTTEKLTSLDHSLFISTDEEASIKTKARRTTTQSKSSNEIDDTNMSPTSESAETKPSYKQPKDISVDKKIEAKSSAPRKKSRGEPADVCDKKTPVDKSLTDPKKANDSLTQKPVDPENVKTLTKSNLKKYQTDISRQDEVSRKTSAKMSAEENENNAVCRREYRGSSHRKTSMKKKSDAVTGSMHSISSTSTASSVPSYMRPTGESRRHSRHQTPERDPEDIEDILLNSYQYTRCTKRVYKAPQTYDYTYVIQPDAKPAGGGPGSYSIYFGPREKSPLKSEPPANLLDTSNNSHQTSSSHYSDRELNSHDKTQGTVRKPSYDSTRTYENVEPVDLRSSKSPRRDSDAYLPNKGETYPEIRQQYIDTVRNIDAQSKEAFRRKHSEDFRSNEEQIYDEKTELTSHTHQQTLDESSTSNRKAMPPKTQAPPEFPKPTLFDTKANQATSDKEDLQQKYNFQVENRLRQEAKDISTTDSQNNALLSIDFNKVYAERLNKSKESELEVSRHDVNYVQKQSETSYESSSRYQQNSQTESHYVTIDGRIVDSQASSTNQSDQQLMKSEAHRNADRLSDQGALVDAHSRSLRQESNFESESKQEFSNFSEMKEKRSFLSDNSKVSGIQDVLSRMGATEAVDHESKVTSDDQARSLLNKFLGAQVLMSGVESMMANSAVTDNRTPQHGMVQRPGLSRGGQVASKRAAFSSVQTVTSSTSQQSEPFIYKGVNINEVGDSFELNELLDSCEEYEARRRIRMRLKDVVAKEKAEFEGQLNSCTRRTSSGAGKVRTVGSVRSNEDVAFVNAWLKDNFPQHTNKSALNSVSKGGTRSHVTKTFSTGQKTTGQSALNKFKQLDSQQPAAKSNYPIAPVSDLARIKQFILKFCRKCTADYADKGVNIENFSTSWNDGMAFCALIHHFYPDAFDFNSLDPKNRRYNFSLAFRVADERAGVFPLLDVDDMVMMQKPDWKCVFTYVQTLYKRLKDE